MWDGERCGSGEEGLLKGYSGGAAAATLQGKCSLWASALWAQTAAAASEGPGERDQAAANRINMERCFLPLSDSAFCFRDGLKGPFCRLFLVCVVILSVCMCCCFF